MREAQSFDALVLAGGVNRIPLYPGYVPGYKALVPIAGRAAIRYTLDALQQAGPVRQIWIIGEEAALASEVQADASPAPIRFAPGGDTPLDSLLHGLDCCRDTSGVLVATADLPLLTPAAVQDFLTAQATVPSRWERNLFLSFVPERCYTGEYTHFTKPFNRFRDVAVCHGNLALLDPRITDNAAALEELNRLYRHRKNPLISPFSAGPVLGLAFVMGVYLLHALTLGEFAEVASRHFHLGVVPVLLEHPEVTIDLDDADDYRFVLEHFRHSGDAAEAARCGSRGGRTIQFGRSPPRLRAPPLFTPPELRKGRRRSLARWRAWDSLLPGLPPSAPYAAR